jgi:hypothetical protein
VARQAVIAEGGPLSGDPNVTVEHTDRDWPADVVWRTGPGPEERHLYRFREMSVSSSGGRPVYEYVRTLAADE